MVEVAERLQDIGIQALTVHGRTRVQMYKGEADWTLIARIKENPRMRIPIFGNGDIDSPAKAQAVLRWTGADALMIGRAAQGRPWIFGDIAHFLEHGVERAGLRFPLVTDHAARFVDDELDGDRDARDFRLRLRAAFRAVRVDRRRGRHRLLPSPQRQGRCVP